MTPHRDNDRQGVVQTLTGGEHHSLWRAWLKRASALQGGEAQPLHGLEEVVDGRQPPRSDIQQELFSMENAP